MTARNKLYWMIVMVGLIVSLFMPDAWAESLVELDKQDNGTVSYYDRDSVREVPTNMRLWVKTIFGKVDKNRAINDLKRENKCRNCEKLSYSKSLYEINCDESMIRIKTVTYHYRAGNILYTDSASTDWLDIIPDTVLGGLKRSVCK